MILKPKLNGAPPMTRLPYAGSPGPSPADARRERVVTAALAVAARDGWANMTREAVAAEAGVAAGTVNNAVAPEGGDMRALRDVVMVQAVATGALAVVAQGLTAGHAAARGAPLEMRQAAMAAMVG